MESYKHQQRIATMEIMLQGTVANLTVKLLQAGLVLQQLEHNQLAIDVEMVNGLPLKHVMMAILTILMDAAILVPLILDGLAIQAIILTNLKQIQLPLFAIHVGIQNGSLENSVIQEVLLDATQLVKSKLMLNATLPLFKDLES